MVHLGLLEPSQVWLVEIAAAVVALVLAVAVAVVAAAAVDLALPSASAR